MEGTQNSGKNRTSGRNAEERARVFARQASMAEEQAQKLREDAARLLEQAQHLQQRSAHLYRYADSLSWAEGRHKRP